MAPVVMPFGLPLLLAVPAVPPKLLLPPLLALPLLPLFEPNIPPSSPYWLLLEPLPHPDVELTTRRMPPPNTAPSVDHRAITSSSVQRSWRTQRRRASTTAP
jgi:hypothetical protein